LEHATWRRPLQISFISGRDSAIHGVTHSKANFPARLEFVGRRHSGFIYLYLVPRSRRVIASHPFLRGTTMSGDRFDIHRHITDQIITMLESANTSDFHLPWHGAARGLARPTNVASRKAYQGVNILSLWAAAIEKGYSSGIWGTFKQWGEEGAQVLKSKRWPISFHLRPVPLMIVPNFNDLLQMSVARYPP
jgi:N-terminal domain of anti-restriction factor ArdC